MDIQKKRLCICPLFTDFDNTFSICKCAYLGKFESSSPRCRDIEGKEIKRFRYSLDYEGISTALDDLLEKGKKFKEIYNLHIPHFLFSNNLNLSELDLLTKNIIDHNEYMINASESILTAN